MSLRVWLPLDGDLHNQGISLLPSLSFNNFTASSNGKIGNCYKGWGIYHLNEEILDNCWSISAWIKADSWYSANNIIICKNATAGDVYQIYFSIVGTNQIRLGINNASGITYNNYTFTTGQWHHVVGTYDGKVGAIYINGELKISQTVTNAFVSGMNNLSLGCRSSNAAGTTAWVGNNGTDVRYLNDVRIYDHCLSAAEVKEIAQGLVLHYKLDGGLFGNENILTNSSGQLGDASGWTGETSASTMNGEPILITKRINTTSTSRTFCTKGNIQSLITDWTAGDDYTLSGWYYVPSSEIQQVGANMFIRWTYTKSDGTATTTDRGFTTPLTVKDQWVRFEYTWQVPAGHANNQAANFYLAAFAAQSLATVYWKKVKLEKGDVATPWCPADSELDIDRTLIEDSSGYNHNGTIVGSVVSTADTVRYDASTHINGAGVITTVSPGADIRTLSCWVKTTKNKSTSQMLVADSGSNMCISFYSGTIIGVFGTTRSTGSKCTLGTSYKENDWNHIVVVKTSDDGKRDIYCNGEKLTPAADDYWSATAGFFVGNRNGAVSGNTPFYGYISDVRAYCTQLLDTDIKQLYNISMKIDKSSKIHTFEVLENNQNKITKQGQLKCANIIEFDGLSYLKYDPNLYIEPDGSCWIHIFHHNNPASYKFSSSDTFTTGVYKDINRWFNFDICNEVDKWEFITRAKRTVDDTEQAYRWIQTVNPMVATFDQTKVVNITKVSGYDTWSLGGLYKLNSSTYLTANNGTNGNWFGATGCWTAWNGGIPGWINTNSANAITTGYIDIYLRIDNISTATIPNVKSTKNNLWLTSNIIER